MHTRFGIGIVEDVCWRRRWRERGGAGLGRMMGVRSDDGGQLWTEGEREEERETHTHYTHAHTHTLITHHTHAHTHTHAYTLLHNSHTEHAQNTHTIALPGLVYPH